MKSQLGLVLKQFQIKSSEHQYLDKIVEKMIQQSSEDRYQSIKEIKIDLIGYKNNFIEQQKLSIEK